MPIIKKNDVRPERPVILVLYGQPGSGKTSIATTANNPVIIDCDRGSDRAVQIIDTLVANKWTEIMESVADLPPYKTVVVDTAKAALDDFLSQYVCDLNYKLKTNSLKRFGQMADEFKDFVGKIQSFGSDIIFICHDKETSEGDVTKHAPDCTGSSKDLLLRKADQVGYVSLVNGKRFISFNPKDNFVGKNVAQIADKQIPEYGTPEFASFMADIIDKVKSSIHSRTEAQRKANALLEELRAELDKVSDNKTADELMKKCVELPQVMKQPFFAEIKENLSSKGFTYAEGKFTKPAEGKAAKTKKSNEK